VGRSEVKARAPHACGSILHLVHASNTACHALETARSSTLAARAGRSEAALFACQPGVTACQKTRPAPAALPHGRRSGPCVKTHLANGIVPPRSADRLFSTGAGPGLKKRSRRDGRDWSGKLYTYLGPG
jgi:hypothetical protein